MIDTNVGQKFHHLIQLIAPQSRLRRSWQLAGGGSAQMTALEIEDVDGQIQKLVVRRYGDAELGQNPQVAPKEFKLLQILQAHELPTPMPFYLDQSGDIFPTPYIVIEYIDGTPEFAPADVADFACQFATTLSQIHRVSPVNADLAFLPQRTTAFAENLGQHPESAEMRSIRVALEAVKSLHQLNDPVLLHGDFWQGNLLWKNGQIVGVIDWEDTKLGDPLSDFAISRLDMLLIFGFEAMQNFTHQYQSMTTFNFAHLPYWDLCAALRAAPNLGEWAAGFPSLGRNDITEKAMREAYQWFVAKALEKLAEQGTT